MGRCAPWGGYLVAVQQDSAQQLVWVSEDGDIFVERIIDTAQRSASSDSISGDIRNHDLRRTWPHVRVFRTTNTPDGVLIDVVPIDRQTLGGGAIIWRPFHGHAVVVQYSE